MADQRKAHECEHCNLVYYSKGALTRHVNKEHWDELEYEETERS